MENTSLGFKKPTENEYYDIGTVNHNTQLANDLIEDNSSAIGQKLDKSGGILTGNLKLPTITIGLNNNLSYYSFVVGMSGLSTNLVEREIEFTGFNNKFFFGTIEIELTSHYNSGDGRGVIKKTMSLMQGVNPTAFSEYTQLIGGTPHIYMLSDIYINSKGKHCFKIIQRNNSQNTVVITIKALGSDSLISFLDIVTIGPLVASSETFIAPSMTPVETVITTNFSTGWSGQIGTRKSADNWVEVTIHLLTKNVDISTTQDVLYTLPTELRPKQSKVKVINLFNNSTTPINNSFADIIVGPDGRITLLPLNGTNLATARRIYGVVVGYYVD